MGLVSACAFSFMSKYLHQSCGPKPMTRVDINDNNQSSNTQMVTSNQMRIKEKVQIIVRVGRIIINPRTKIIMGNRMIMLERERKRNVR
jgi:hypothetical protein